MDTLFLVNGNSEDISCKAIFTWGLGICVAGICQAEGVVVVGRQGAAVPTAAIEILVSIETPNTILIEIILDILL